MTDSAQSEERYPLLFLFLDDTNKTSRKNKNVFFERSRSQGIMSGATSVLTQWPGHVSSCGLAVIILIMSIFFFFLMLLASTAKPVNNNLRPRCLRRSYDGLDTNLFLVHEDSSWFPDELDVLENILTKYTQCEVQLLILRDENSFRTTEYEMVKYNPQPTRLKRQTKQNKSLIPKNNSEEKVDLNINIGAKKLLKAFLERRRHLNATLGNLMTSTTNAPHIPNIEDILIRIPRIVVRNITKRAFFEDSPLYGVWRNFNKDVLNFAARILKLWENGGISFEIPSSQKINNTRNYYKYNTAKGNLSTIAISTTATARKLDRTISPINENKLLKSMLEVGYASFRHLPEGLVTVDEEGIHMETKTTCHAFFGEVLVQLKHANTNTTVPEVIKNTLKTFCIRGAVDSEYCNSVKSI